MDPNLQDAHDFIAALATRGLSFRLRDNRLWLWPTKGYALLTAEERKTMTRLRPALKAIVRDGLLPVVSDSQTEPPAQPVAQRKVEPTPEVWARGVRITEDHVTTVLSSLGDHMLAAYKAGRLSKLEAFELARLRELHAQELLGRYYRP